MRAILLKAYLRFIGLFYRDLLKHSLPAQGDTANMDNKERFWLGYKNFVGPVEEPEPGKGIEERFAGQDFSFDYGDGFAEAAGFSLAAGGDILANARLEPGNMGALWDELRDFYFGADLAVANLETPLAPSKPPSYLPDVLLDDPILNNSTETFDRLTEGGKLFDLFSTANNHCLDMGEAGLRETLDFLDAKGYPHVGTSRSPEERDAPPVIERGGVKTAFLSYTFGINKRVMPEGKDYLANRLRLNMPGIDISPIRRQVEAARAAGADAVVLFPHWSLEYECFPVQDLIDNAHRMAELGIDVIVGNHAHNIQPVENYAWTDPATGRKRRCLIAYALGNLISYSPSHPNTRLAYLLRLRLSKGRAGGAEEVRVASLEVKPFFHHATVREDRWTDYRLLDLAKLEGDLAAGSNPLGLSKKDAADAARLGKLCRRVLGPALGRG